MGDPRQNHGQVDVVLQIEGIQQIEFLEHKAQMIPPEVGNVLFPDFGNVLIFQQHRAGGGLIQRRQNIQQGGFAGAGLAHDSHVLPLLQVEIHIPQGLHAVAPKAGGVYLFQMFNR